MELDILFLNVLKYKDKETGREKFRIEYILNDSTVRQNNITFKGVKPLAFYTFNSLPFEKFTEKDALQPMILKVEQKPSASNPLKLISQVTAIKTKNDNISLL